MSKINRRFRPPSREFNIGEHRPNPVTPRNARLAGDPTTLDAHGFCRSSLPSAIRDFRDQDQLKRDSPAEAIAIAKRLTGAAPVVAMGDRDRAIAHFRNMTARPK